MPLHRYILSEPQSPDLEHESADLWLHDNFYRCDVFYGISKSIHICGRDNAKHKQQNQKE